ncbi:HPP family protein [Deinococcus radiopugnans]|nr:CBS domain-containing protein [Deinococcus radiopugnans]MBB6016928.1 putative transcriptional regulator [Deinococcus radiopugnans ATCC 19172]
MKDLHELTLEELRYFLRLLRQARYAALDDAEDFISICFALEEIGLRILGEKRTGLGGYQDALTFWVKDARQDQFSANLRRLIGARNDKSHTGAYARNAVTKAVAVGSVLEDCLMARLMTVEDIMTEGVVFAEPFMSLAKVRELMLSHSFSFLPVKWGEKFGLLSDREVARLWRTYAKKDSEPHLTPLRDLIAQGKLSPGPVNVIEIDTKLQDQVISAEPQLVVNAEGYVVGIISAFDWL